MSNPTPWPVVPPHGFHPVIHLPAGYPVFDLSGGPAPERHVGQWGVGKYNEKRPGIYNTPLFEGRRDNHVGIDISGPVGTPIHAFDEGIFRMLACNEAPGDYGHVMITEHLFQGKPLYALWGHLQARSIAERKPGQRFRRGEVIAWIGAPHENGGWPNPHLHFQLSTVEPSVCDMPGVVSDADLPEALLRYPDPRLVLGPLY